MISIENIEKRQISKLTADKKIPDFSPGDTVKVDVRVSEGGRERLQAFEGVCIARSSRGINSSFTVRKISYGEGVERVFPLYSPVVERITLVRRGKVRRAKLYYLRGRRGKSARIIEKQDLKAIAAAKEAKAETLKPQADSKASATTKAAPVEKKTGTKPAMKAVAKAAKEKA